MKDKYFSQTKAAYDIIIIMLLTSLLAPIGIAVVIYAVVSLWRAI